MPLWVDVVCDYFFLLIESGKILSFDGFSDSGGGLSDRFSDSGGFGVSSVEGFGVDLFSDSGGGLSDIFRDSGGFGASSVEGLSINGRCSFFGRFHSLFKLGLSVSIPLSDDGSLVLGDHTGFRGGGSSGGVSIHVHDGGGGFGLLLRARRSSLRSRVDGIVVLHDLLTSLLDHLLGLLDSLALGGDLLVHDLLGDNYLGDTLLVLFGGVDTLARIAMAVETTGVAAATTVS